MEPGSDKKPPVHAEHEEAPAKLNVLRGQIPEMETMPEELQKNPAVQSVGIDMPDAPQ